MSLINTMHLFVRISLRRLVQLARVANDNPMPKPSALFGAVKCLVICNCSGAMPLPDRRGFAELAVNVEYAERAIRVSVQVCARVMAFSMMF